MRICIMCGMAGLTGQSDPDALGLMAALRLRHDQVPEGQPAPAASLEVAAQ